jgi:hypothetical protein
MAAPKRQTRTLKEALLSQAESALREWFPNGKVRGHEFMVGGVSGEAGESLKVDLRKGVWCDFAAPDSMKGGDLLSLYEKSRGLTWQKAYDELAPKYGISDGPEVPVRALAPAPRKEPPAKSDAIVPVPEEHWNGYPKRGTAQYRYLSRDGILTHVICRHDGEDGKWFEPWHYTEKGWKVGAIPKPWPLYNAHHFHPTKGRTGKRVYVVEGEKCADRLAAVATSNKVVTWQSGAVNWKHADWTLLRGVEEVAIWPDYDAPGLAAAEGIAETLHKMGVKVKILDLGPHLELLPPEARDGADCVDFLNALPEADFKPLVAAVNAAAKFWGADKAEAEPEEVVEPGKPEIPVEAPDSVDYLLPLALGMEGDSFVVLDRAGPKIWNFNHSSMMTALRGCGDDEDWQRSKYADRGKLDFAAIGNIYKRRCMKLGAISADLVKEFGVWMDDGRIVANFDRNRLLVDGVWTKASQFKTSHVYISRGGWPGAAEPLDTETAGTALSAMGLLNWAHPYHGIALAGWIAVAPLAGVLKWRPNLWLSAPSNTGKTWTLNHVVRPLLRPVEFYISGNATEAGIRQHARDKAIPIIWDEFEAENSKAADRTDDVMQLVRTSTSDFPRIVKGGATGQSQSFGVPFSWLFASINNRMRATADLNRTLGIEFLPRRSARAEQAAAENRFRQLERLVNNWPTDIGLRWMWRSVAQARNILQSIETVSPYIIKAAGENRAADVHGALLAGYWSIGHDAPMTDQDAEELVGGIYADFREYASRASTNTLDVSDGEQCLRTMLDTRVHASLADRTETRSLREVIAAAYQNGGPWLSAMKAFGLGFDREKRFLQVAVSHRELEKIMAGTIWARGWAQAIVNNLNEAKMVDPRDFQEDGARVTRRAVAVPLGYCELNAWGVKVV